MFFLSRASESDVIDVTCARRVVIDEFPRVISFETVAEDACTPAPIPVLLEPVVF
jgi:hypothetical protein